MCNYCHLWNCFSFSEQRHWGADAWGISESHQWALHSELNITVSTNLLCVCQAVVSSAPVSWTWLSFFFRSEPACNLWSSWPDTAHCRYAKSAVQPVAGHFFLLLRSWLGKICILSLTVDFFTVWRGWCYCPWLCFKWTQQSVLHSVLIANMHCCNSFSYRYM